CGHLRQASPALAFTDFGGIAKKVPFLGYAFGMAAFASIGLPGFANFAGEIMVFFGAFASDRIPGTFSFSAIQVAVICGLWGVVISAVYMLRAFRKLFMGEQTGTAVVAEPAPIMRWALILLIVALLIGGMWPRSYLSFIQPSVEALIGK
ncbi:MAG: proton-conducting transporter membrane subunit, partial [Chthoniobacteraceae bacterium]